MTSARRIEIGGIVCTVAIVACLIFGIVKGVIEPSWKLEQARQIQIIKNANTEVRQGEYERITDYVKSHPEAVPYIKEALVDGVLTQGEVEKIDIEIHKIDVARKKLKWIDYAENINDPHAIPPLFNASDSPTPVLSFGVIYCYNGGEKDGEEFVLWLPSSKRLELDEAYDVLKVLTPEVCGYRFNGVSSENGSIIVDLRSPNQYPEAELPPTVVEAELP